MSNWSAKPYEQRSDVDTIIQDWVSRPYMENFIPEVGNTTIFDIVWENVRSPVEGGVWIAMRDSFWTFPW